MGISEQTLNRLNVLKAIHRSGPLARGELVDLTGLSGATITQITADLVRRGLISENRVQAGKRLGRPLTFLQISASASVVMGVSISEIGVVNAAFVDLAGNKLFDIDRAIPAPQTLEGFAQRLVTALQSAIDASPFERSQISRIGIALPAIVDSIRGVVYFMATLPSGAVPVAQIIGDSLQLPVMIENEILCMARAEHWFGRAQQLDNFNVIYVGHYVGSAEYVAGLPRLGANGFSSELGHTKIVFGDDAPRCYCGASGCLAATASIYGITSRSGNLKKLDNRSIANLTRAFRDVLTQAECGHPAVVTAFDDAALQLGVSIANRINATDPGHLLVLLSHDRMLGLLGERILDVVRQNTLPELLARTRIELLAVDSDWRWKGTAALALERLYLEDADERLIEAGLDEVAA